MLINVSRKKQTLWRTLFLYLDNILSILNGFVIVPLYLYYINIDLYGAWLASGNIIVWMTIIDPGIGDVLTQRIAEAYGRRDLETIKMQISSSVILSFIIAVIAFSASIIFVSYLQEILGLSENIDIEQLKTAFLVSAFGTGISLIGFSFGGALVGLQKSKEQGMLRTISGVISFIFKLIFLYTGFGLMSIPYGVLIGSMFLLFGMLISLFKIIKNEKIGYGFNIKYFFNYSKIFYFTFSSKVFTIFRNNIDLVLIARFINPETVTLLELSRRPMKIIYNFVKMPSIALIPSIAHLKSEGDKIKLQSIIKKIVFISLYALSLLTTGIILFNEDFIALWVGRDLFIGSEINILLSFSFMIITFNYILSNVSYSLGNIKGNSLNGIIRDISILILLIISGYYFGLYGIILAPLIGSLVIELYYYPLHLSRFFDKSIKFFYNLILSNYLVFIVSFFIAIIFLFINIKIENWFELIFSIFMFSFFMFGILWFLSISFRTIIKEVFTLLNKKNRQST